MPTGKRIDWAHRHNFLVEIGGITYGGFHEVTGLEAGFEVVEYREGGEWTHTHKFQGQGRAGNITFKSGIIASASLFADWVQSAAHPAPLQRRSGSVVLKDDAGKEIKRWDFTRSWPVSWRLGDLSSDGAKELIMEELVIAVDTIVPHKGADAGSKSGK